MHNAITEDAKKALTLGYSGGKFLFDAEGDYMSVPNMQRIRLAAGRTVWGFDALYPAALVTLKHLKQSHTLQAVNDAAPVAKHVVTVENVVSNMSTLDEFGDMFRVSPYAHQAYAILKMLYYDRLAILFEQGLGKTYIAIMSLAIRQRMQNARTKMVVVAPKIVAPNWKREVQKFAPHLKAVELYGDAKAREKQKALISEGDWDVLTTTYDMIGGSKSSEKRLQVSKAVKIEYWCGLPRAERVSYMTVALTKKSLTSEEAQYLCDAPYPKKKVDSAALWAVLSKVSKMLDNKQAYALQNKQEELPFLLGQDYGVLVLDEASRVKDHKSGRTGAALDLGAKCSNIYLLSGTLCNGSPKDFYAPFTILNRNLWGSFTAFEKKYIVYRSMTSKIIWNFKNLDHMKVVVDPYKYQAVRSECIDLPERQIIEVGTTLTSDAVSLYNEIATTENTFITVGTHYINTATAAVKINKLHQLLSGFIIPTHRAEDVEVCNSCPNVISCTSADAVVYPWSEKCEFREQHGILKKPQMPIFEYGCSKIEQLESDLLDNDNKSIIWSMFRYDQEKICNLLNKLGIKYVTASTPGCDKLFEEDPSIRVFTGQVGQGIGITLNTADITYYYSHTHNLEHRLQSMDRNYRIGQTKKVLVRDYVDKGSIEYLILQLLNHKVNVQEFLQRPLDCIQCEKKLVCANDNTKIYSKDCVHYGDRVIAENKKTIKLAVYDGEELWRNAD